MRSKGNSPVRASLLNVVGALLCVWGAPAESIGQDILVAGGSDGNYAIPHDSEPSNFAVTDFHWVYPDVLLYPIPPISMKATYRICNLDADTSLSITGPATLSGDSEFAIVTQPGPIVPPLSYTTVTVSYKPGGSHAVLTIPNDDADISQQSYAVNLRGEVAGGGTEQHDFDLTVRSVKASWEDGELRLKVAVDYWDERLRTSYPYEFLAYPELCIYLSDDRFFSANDEPVETIALKEFPPAKEGKTARIFKLRTKIRAPGPQFGYLSAQIRSGLGPWVSSLVQEVDYADNMAIVQYGADGN